MELWERSNYLIDIPFIFNNYIREYDISKANISILLWKKAISVEQYNFLLNSPREVRQYSIGMMQRENENIKNTLQSGFKECRKMFFDSNGLEYTDIISVKNDAIFVLNKTPKITTFGDGLINFSLKNVYTSYMSLHNKHVELYYHRDKITGDEKLDVKGISSTKMNLHKDYFMDFLYYLFDFIETDSIENTISILRGFMSQYGSKEIDVGYYRTFNESSIFILNWDGTKTNKIFGIDSYAQAYKYMDSINISYNYNLLREIYKYISSIYFSRH